MLSRYQEKLKHLMQAPWMLLALLILVLSTSCNTTKYLKGEEKFLAKNSVTIEKAANQNLPPNLSYNLTTLYKQEKNSSWVFIPAERIYEKNQERVRNGKNSKKWREKRGEPIAVYDEALTKETRQNMEYYLNNQGYFDAEVGYEVLPKGKKGIKVIYNIQPKMPYNVTDIEYKSKDPAIAAILQNISSQSKLSGSARVSQQKFSEEFARIVNHLRNNGYAKMDQTYFKAEGDSTNHKVKVSIEVLTPRTQENHQVYSIGTISVFPKYYASSNIQVSQDSVIDGVHFKTIDNLFNIRPETILRNIFIRENMIYDQRLVNKTKTQLNNLNSFRIISLQPKIREDDPSIMDFDIYLTPRKRLSIQSDLEVNNSLGNLGGSRTNLLGTSLRTNFKNFNSFKNATEFSLGLGGGVEFNLSNLDDPIFSADFSSSVQYSFPRYIKWLGPYGILNSIPIGKDSLGVRKKLLSNRAFNLIREKARSKIDMGYNYVDIFAFYNYHSLKLNFGYTIPLNSKSTLNISQSGATLFRPETEDDFKVLLAQNQFLERSFDPQLFTGVFFRRAAYSYQSPVNRFGESWNFLGEFDLSGFEIFTANKIYNGLASNKDTLRLSDEVDFAQFIKLQLFSSYTRNFGPDKAVAFRLNLGAAQPFGYSKGAAIPYVEQFFAGGNNSMRGWRTRELGPGAYDAIGAGDTSDVFFQAGDLKFEANAEVRFPLFWYLEGAVFVDVGNIWTIREDPDRINSQFRFSRATDPDGNELTPFYEQLAIASGFGLRIDASYFIIRVDIGMKIKNPYKDPVDGSYWFPNLSPSMPFNIFSTPNYTFGLGYPF